MSRVSMSLPTPPEVGQTWTLRKNCSISPRQFVCFYGALAGAALSIATVCAASGAWMVLPCAGLELVGVAALFLLYARHAVDLDRIMLGDGRLVIEQRRGARQTRVELNPLWTQVALQSGRNPRIEIRYAGSAILVGEYVPVYRRAVVAQELRRCLREFAPHAAEQAQVPEHDGTLP
jgi:uncharacterized membrane protein